MSNPWCTNSPSSINVGPRIAIVVPKQKKQPQYRKVRKGSRQRSQNVLLSRSWKLSTRGPFSFLLWAIATPRRYAKGITVQCLHGWSISRSITSEVSGALITCRVYIHLLFLASRPKTTKPDLQPLMVKLFWFIDTTLPLTRLKLRSKPYYHSFLIKHGRRPSWGHFVKLLMFFASTLVSINRCQKLH